MDSSSTLIPLILKEIHDTTHEGFEKTLHRVQQTFHWHWKNMVKTIKSWIGECTICQTNKISNLCPTGLLSPLSIPQLALLQISMDFIACLPKSNGK